MVIWGNVLFALTAEGCTVLLVMFTLPLLVLFCQVPSGSEDEAASSSGEEEDAEAKAERLGKRMAGGKPRPAPSRRNRAEGNLETIQKKKRKRTARSDALAAGDEDRPDSRMMTSSGPVGVEVGAEASAGQSAAFQQQLLLSLACLMLLSPAHYAHPPALSG